MRIRRQNIVVKVGRNETCPCGSGKKYKKCCLPLDEIGARQPVAGEDGRWVEVGAQAEFVRYVDGGVILRECIQDKKGKIIPGKLGDEFFVPNEMILSEEVPVTSCSRGSSIKQKETRQRTFLPFGQRGRPKAPVSLKEVQDLVVEGKSFRIIAKELNISKSTVANRLKECPFNV